jgi:glutaredoxin
MGDGFLFSLLVMGLICGVISMLIWQNKGGTPSGGFSFGFLLGIIGVILVLVLNPPGEKTDATSRECPHCKEAMRRDASVCPHCQRDSEPWTFHDGRWWMKNERGWVWLDEPKQEWREFVA